jgi:hypothetical protein
MFVGKAGSGKDFLGLYLENNFSYRTFAIADEFKTHTAKLFGLPLSYFYSSKDDVIKEYNITGREILHKLSDIYLKIDPYIWIRKVEPFFNLHERLIITDLRYINEYEFVKKHNPHIIYIESPNCLDKPYLNHESESYSEYFKSIATEKLYNDGTDEFVRKVHNKLFYSE